MAPASPRLQPLSVPSPRGSTEADVQARYTREVLEQDPVVSPASEVSNWDEQKKPHSRIRHAIGILLLLATVFLWTASNFLASTIFADDSYTKPYLVTYVNTAFFIIPLVPMFLKHAWDDRSSAPQPLLLTIRDLLQRRVGRYKLLRDHESRSSSVSSSKSRGSNPSDGAAAELLLGDDMQDSYEAMEPEGLTLRETLKLSLEFCMLWFCANYFAAACLSHTTVASATILGSTSSIWTLLVGALMRVERFTMRKLLGVMASLAGVALISSIDASGETDENRGTFPHKTPRELAIGDAMAFFSAVLYGFYGVLMKKRIGDETKVNMPLFFGLVGLFNVVLLWPGMFILHWTGIETFELPPTNRILVIVLVNSASSLVSDFSWAYAMLLTSPLVVSVGLSLTIPLSLIGQMILDAQYSSALYWVGAVIMFISFVFINREEQKGEGDSAPAGESILADSFHSRRDSLRGRRSSVRSSRSIP